MDNNYTKEFKIKDIVWAKAKGNPWWPGIIKNISFYNIEKDNQIIKEKVYKIDFIGEKSHVTLTKEYIELFIDNYKEHLSTKNQSLIKSIKLAKDLYNKRCSQKNNNIYSEENSNGNIIEKKEYKNKDKIYLNNKRKKSDNCDTNSNYEQSMCDMESGSERNYKDYKNYMEHKNKKKIRKNNLIQNNNNDSKLLFKEKNNKDNNIKINININLTNNNNSTFNIFGIPQINSLKNNNNINHNINKDTLNIINNKIIQDCEEENESRENELIKSNIFLKNKSIKHNKIINDFNNKNEEKIINENMETIKNINIIDEEINKLNQILQLPHQNNILQELNTFYNIMKNNILDNQYQINYIKNKYIISKILNLTFHQNNDIKQISLNIISFLKEYIINDLFLFKEDEKNNLKEEINILSNNNQDKDIKEDICNENKIGQEIHQLIDFLKSIQNQTDKSDNNILEENFNNLNDEINEELYNLINNLKNNNKGKDCEFNNKSEKFYKDIYNKKNNGLTLINSLKRKKICINLFNLIGKIIPESNKETIKKIIIYYEYKIRTEDPILGKKYYYIINNLFKKIKSLL